MTSTDRRSRRTRRDAVRVMVPLLGVWTVGVAVMLFVAALDPSHSDALVTDPSFTQGVHWYTGVVSNIGILGWTVAATAAFAGAAICHMGARSGAGRFLFGGGMVTTVLLVDDLLHLHSIAIPSGLGIPGVLVVAFLAGLVICWLGGHLHEVRRTTVHLLVASAVAFCVSAVVDRLFSPVPGQGWKIVGDGAELLGILAWSTYFVVTARDICRSTFVDALLSWPPEVAASLAEADAADAADLSRSSIAPG